ncbi:MAG: hypothetical protein WCA37_02650 [Terracidiphilus sp.]
MRSSLKNWLDQPVIPRGRAERRQVPGLVAYHADGTGLRPDAVSNISATGVYLRTSTRWPIGASVELTLQRHGQLESTVENRIALQAKPVRWDEEGVALTFLHTKGTDVHLWDGKQEDLNEPVEPVDVVREFRVARAEAFLRRICPSTGGQSGQMLRRGVGSFRIDGAIEIALKAENQMEAEASDARMLIHPEVLSLILENGSWAEADWMRGLWANLLFTSCTSAGKDRDSLTFVQLLSHLNTGQARILTTVCGQAVQTMLQAGSQAMDPVLFSVEQLKRVAGVGDLVRVDRDVQFLGELGLLKRRPRGSYFEETEEFELAPTELGMQLYARSRGQRHATLESFGMVAQAAQCASGLVH